MARTDTLGNFLTDVADAIRTKKGTNETILASNFDTEIENLPSGADLSEYFATTWSSNTSGSQNRGVIKIIKKAPPTITIANNVTDLSTALANWTQEYAPKIICGNNVTNMQSMYGGMYNIKELDITGLNTSNVTSFYQMFSQFGRNVTPATSLDFSNFDTSKVQNFGYMFSYAKVDADFSTFSFDSATSVANMFQYADIENQTINMPNFKTHNLTSLNYFLANCNAKIVNLPNLEIGNITTTNFAFQTANTLQHLDIRKLEFDNVTTYNNMFSGVPNNCEIIVKDDTQKTWITSRFSNLTNVKTVAEYEAEQSE